MDINEVKDFFNACAPSWDAEMIIDENIVNKILDDANIKEDSVILDVATGTGVLIPYYLKRNVRQVIGVDISDEMIKIASSKFIDKRVSFECKDINELICDSYFDSIILYNAFPHFNDPDKLIKHLSKMLKKNGRLSIAHGMSREMINKHHSGSASKVSCDLLDSKVLKEIMSKYLNVINIIDDETMYEVTGEKK